MENLDDPQTYSSLDPSRLSDRLDDLPRQCEEAWQQVSAASLPDLSTRNGHVIICGMGGSAIAGDLVSDLAAAQGLPPVTVVRDFRLPFVPNNRTLVVVCSYSGNTQETLSLFHEAAGTDAAVVVVTRGGTLAHLAAEGGIPILKVDAAGEPRSAVGYNLMLLLGLLRRSHLIRITDEEARSAMEAMSQQINRVGIAVPLKENLAKQLAVEINGQLPVVYGGGLFKGVARRWKSQFNENAKVWAFFETIPELLHNSVEPYSTQAAPGQSLIAIVLEPTIGPSVSANHYRVLAELLKRHNIPHRLLQGSGDHPLTQLLRMMALGDYVSYYLAMLRGTDPSPTPNLESAKDILSNS